MSMREKIIQYVVGIEGGYVNHKDDPGGKTRYGITEAVARKYGYMGDMRNLTVEMATEVYRRRYWEPLKLDDVLAISPSIAFELFDTGVNAGIGRAAPWLQEVLNAFNRQQADYRDLAVDGDIGMLTIGALKALIEKRGVTGRKIVWRALNGLQAAHYLSLPEKFESFKVGWFSHRVGELPAFIKEGD